MEAAISFPKFALHVCDGCPLRNAERAMGIPPASVGLSKAETRIVKLVAEGLSNSKIAERTFNSDHTIKFHLTRIMRKMNRSGEKIENRTQLAIWAFKNGLAE
jgi:DNA-binding NarL/FixJ family response regulator